MSDETRDIVDGYDARFWNDSYRLVRDAVVKHLDSLIVEDDVAEEAIILEAIQRAADTITALRSERDELRAEASTMREVFTQREAALRAEIAMVEEQPRVEWMGIGDIKWVIYYPGRHADRYERDKYGHVASWPTRETAESARTEATRTGGEG